MVGMHEGDPSRTKRVVSGRADDVMQPVIREDSIGLTVSSCESSFV